MSAAWDAVVVGSGPNGLTAAIELQRSGFSVLVLEAAETPGGATATGEVTLPGYLHDHCSAIHPLGRLSPYWRTLPLTRHGLEWLPFEVSVGHPFEDREAAVLTRSARTTAERLGVDGARWNRLVERFLPRRQELFIDLLGPLGRRPRDLLGLASFGWLGLRSALRFVGPFREAPARALFGGCAAHSVLPLEFAGTAAVGLVFAISARVEDWSCARGGSQAITRALVDLFQSEGGSLRCDHRVSSLRDVPDSTVVLFDLAPRVVLDIAGDELPPGYVRRLRRFRHGPGVFKLDWALDGPIPWSDPILAKASTVHVGGTFSEIARSERDAWEGRVSERPFVLVCQQSAVDVSRAPEGKHTGYAYAHVPHGCEVDRTEAIEAQLERFAPGFCDRVLARHATNPADFERTNPNFVGGAITGGANDLRQLFTRPVARFDPYTTPNPRLFFCGASTPPGGGVHGMCGYWAARSAARRLGAGVTADPLAVEPIPAS